MLVRDDAFLEIMKTILLTSSLFPKYAHNCSLQESSISLLPSKINKMLVNENRKYFHKH